jgi:PAS domain S-box-containing protein
MRAYVPVAVIEMAEYSLVTHTSEHNASDVALPDSEERLRFALETSHTGMWDLDLRDHTAHRSLEHDRIFGYEQLLPRWTYEMFLDHVLPEDRPAVDAKFRQATASKSDWSFECRIRRINGEIRWIWAAGRHRTDATGQVDRMAGMVQDVTDRKQAEAALLESQRRLRFTLESARIGDWDMDLRTGEVLRSLEHARCFGETEVPEWNREKFLASIHPEDRSDVERLIQEGLEGQRKWHFECRVIWPDSSVHWIEVHGAVYETGEEEARHAAGIVRDITPRMQAEQELRDSGARLSEANRRLRELAAHLERTLENERLHIARELHDDLGSTLAATKWAVATAINGGKDSGSPAAAQLDQALQLLDSAVDTMRRIITDLRPSVLDQLGVWAAIRWYADQIQGRTGLRCEVSMTPETTECALDPERSTAVFRIVQEALTNVLRHAHARRVDIRVSRSSDQLAIEIQDDGQGIRADALGNAESWGLIGMQERASRFGGEVRVVGAQGEGTTLTLRMPM